jgi:hypothetical protein
MGNLIRQYWFPAIPCFELPSPDCPPKKVRLLGEDLVAGWPGSALPAP